MVQAVLGAEGIEDVGELVGAVDPIREGDPHTPAVLMDGGCRSRSDCAAEGFGEVDAGAVAGAEQHRLGVQAVAGAPWMTEVAPGYRWSPPTSGFSPTTHRSTVRPLVRSLELAQVAPDDSQRRSIGGA